jgi:branched-chain amino acid transport system substrate-binding protein
LRRIRSATTLVVASAVLATSITGCQLRAATQAAGEIVIAADLELSGGAASAGKAYQRALELKTEQVNDSGQLGGRKIRLIVKDNRSDPSESLRNIGEFSDDPSVSAIVMGGCGDCAVGAAKTVNDKRVPTIALAVANAVSNPIAERRYLFKLAPNAVDGAAALTAELRRRGVKKVGLLHTDDGYGLEGLDAMTRELTKAGIKFARPPQSIRTTETDLSQPIKRLTDGKPNALVIWAPAGQTIAAAASAQESGFQGQLFFDSAAASELFLAADAARSVNNATLVFTQTMVIDDVIATTPAKAARKQWFRDYTARYGGYNGFSSFAADAIQLIVDAVGRAGGVGGNSNRDAVRDVIETSQIDGLSGPIRMTPDNHSGLMPQALTMLVARGGRWRLAG